MFCVFGENLNLNKCGQGFRGPRFHSTPPSHKTDVYLRFTPSRFGNQAFGWGVTPKRAVRGGNLSPGRGKFRVDPDLVAKGEGIPVGGCGLGDDDKSASRGMAKDCGPVARDHARLGSALKCCAHRGTGGKLSNGTVLGQSCFRSEFRRGSRVRCADRCSKRPWSRTNCREWLGDICFICILAAESGEKHRGTSILVSPGSRSLSSSSSSIHSSMGISEISRSGLS